MTTGSPTHLRVLVTRPARQATSTCHAIAALGHQVHVLPCLDIVPINPSDNRYQINKAKALDLDHYQHVIVISTNAAEHFLALAEDYWPQWPIRQTYWGMGKTTAALLQVAGLTDVKHSTVGDTSEDLLKALLPVLLPYEKVLIVRGLGGRETLKEALEAQHVQVDYLECYQRQAPNITTDDIVALQAFNPQVVVLQSGETLTHYHQYLAPRLQTLTTKQEHAPIVIVPSQRVLAQAKALGVKNCRQSLGASDNAICDILNTIRDLCVETYAD